MVVIIPKNQVNSAPESNIDVNIKDVIKLDFDLLESAKMVDGNYKEKIIDLNAKVTNMSNIMKNGGGEKIVLQQNHLTDLVKDESARLDNQRKSIETAKTSQERMISLNENYVKRNIEYWKIFIVCSIEITLISVLYILKLPTSIFLILAIITGGGAAIYSINTLINIYSRDGIQFDELALDSPLSVTKNEISPPINKDASGNLIGTADSKTCYGNSCCSTTTMWNPKIQQCDKLVDGFSTINSAYDNSMIVEKQTSKTKKHLDNIIPFESNASKKYSKI
jgi:hypothetical protein